MKRMTPGTYTERSLSLFSLSSDGAGNPGMKWETYNQGDTEEDNADPHKLLAAAIAHISLSILIINYESILFKDFNEPK